jgi:nicotinamide riboside transporter PnuC
MKKVLLFITLPSLIILFFVWSFSPNMEVKECKSVQLDTVQTMNDSIVIVIRENVIKELPEDPSMFKEVQNLITWALGTVNAIIFTVVSFKKFRKKRRRR